MGFIGYYHMGQRLHYKGSKEKEGREKEGGRKFIQRNND